MSARRWMRLRTAVERKTVDPSDPYKQESWETVAAEVPCWRWSTASRRFTSDEAAVPIKDLRLVVPLGTDVRGDDRIGDVVTRRGRVVQYGPVRVDVIETRTDHLELSLTEV